MENKIKDWAREKAKEVHRISYTQLDDWHVIEVAILEAYERGQEDRDDISRRLDKKLSEAYNRHTADETLLREARVIIAQFMAAADCNERVCKPWSVYQDSVELLSKLKSRLAPSVGLSEGKS